MRNWFAELVERGGPQLLSIFQLALPLVAVCVFHAVRPRRWALWAGAIGCALVVLIGVTGYVQSSGRTDDAIARMREEHSASEAELAEHRERGYAEARLPLVYGGGLAAGCAIVLAIGEVRRRRRARSSA